jgi:hypothetical protein
VFLNIISTSFFDTLYLGRHHSDLSLSIYKESLLALKHQNRLYEVFVK